MKKKALVTFISKSFSNSEENYKAILPNGENKTFTGIKTNDAPTKYLLYKAQEDGTPIDKIICIVSKDVYNDKVVENDMTYYEFFQYMVKSSGYAKENIEFALVPYDMLNFNCPSEEKLNQEQKILITSGGITKELKDCSKVYIDSTGGLRDINIYIAGLIQYLKFKGITCNDIIYSNYSEKTIEQIDFIFDLFYLVSAVEQFLETGSANMLNRISQKITHHPTIKLIESLNNFSHMIALCNIKEVDGAIEGLTKSINDIENIKEDISYDVNVHLLIETLEIIKKKFYLDNTSQDSLDFNAPKLIKWCVDNNLLQQALTLYVEKMPNEYARDKLFIAPPDKIENKLMPGQTANAANFYTNLPESILESLDPRVSAKENFNELKKQLIKIIKDLSFQLENVDNYYTNINSILKDWLSEKKQKKELQSAKQRINCIYDKRYNKKRQIDIYNAPIQQRSFLTFIKYLASGAPEYVYHYLLFNNIKEYEDLFKMDTNNIMAYQKRIEAIKQLPKVKNLRQFTTKLTTQELQKLMQHYLAVKILRNRANHAVETDHTVDEQFADGYFKKIQIDLEPTFESVRSVISNGLKITNPELFKEVF